MTKRSENLGLIVPTAAEDAAIAAGIAQDLLREGVRRGKLAA